MEGGEEEGSQSPDLDDNKKEKIHLTHDFYAMAFLAYHSPTCIKLDLSFQL